jgi:hypothetical protein
MFVSSYNMILGPLYTLLFWGGVLVFCSLLLGRLIVNFPRLFFGLFSLIIEIFTFSFEAAIRLLRLLAIHYIFSFIINKINNYCLRTGLGQAVILIGCVSFIVFSPGEFSTEEITMLTIAGSLVIFKLLMYFFPTPEKTYYHYDDEEATYLAKFNTKPQSSRTTRSSSQKRTSSPSQSDQTLWLLERAKQLEKQAFKAYRLEQFYDALNQYHKALDIYQSPTLAAYQDLDIKRAKLLEKIGIVLYKEEKLTQALNRLNEALDFYQKPHLTHLVKERAKVLKESAVILAKLGRHTEASQRSKLVAQLIRA